MGRHGRCVNGTGHGAADNDLTLAHGVNFTSLENLRAILTIIKVSRPCRSTGCHSRGQNSAERSPLYAGTGASDGWYQYRSEEHTSELQSLMRISYAVFCLKKTKRISIHILYLSLYITT